MKVQFTSLVVDVASRQPKLFREVNHTVSMVRGAQTSGFVVEWGKSTTLIVEGG